MNKSKEFVLLVKQGYNVCLTGGGGVGKTYTLNQIVNIDRKPTAFTATTGIASSHLPNGQTIHSLVGMGALNHPDDIFRIVNGKYWKQTQKTIQTYRRIIVDEISMFSANQLTLLDQILRHAHERSHAPFGGVQMIFVGDFLQLPPVITKADLKKMKERGEDQVWPFESNSWKSAEVKTVHLTEVKRQNDLEFVDALNKIRMGLIDDQAFRIFDPCLGKKFKEDIRPVTLMSRNKMVDSWNEYELRKIEGEPITLKGSWKARNFHLLDMVTDSTITPNEMEVKIDCQMMITRNGNYDDCSEEGNFVSYHNGTMVKLIDILPLRAVPDYNIEYFNPRFGTHQEVLKLEIIKTGQIVYIGKFDFLTQVENNDLKFINTKFKEEYGWEEKDFTEFDARFTQYPVKVAYALSIHKSQGMTVDYAEIDFRGMFADGQAYVALSRVTSLEGLKIKNFDSRYIRANEKALNFYKELE